MLKTTKRYVFNSDRVNNYGFRLLSAGVDQSQFNNNKLMLWMHYRPSGARKDEVLGLGFVDDIKIDNDGVMDGQPYFDDTDEFAKAIYNKYENGTYNMFSLCALPLEMSMEPEDLLPGQTGPTITKSLLKEISAVDIGGNPDACGVELCDENGQLIKLADGVFDNLLSLTIKKDNMKLTDLDLTTVLPLLKLSDSATQKEAVAAITALANQANELVQLKDSKEKADAKVIELTGKVTELEKSTGEVKLAALIETAVLERKITKAEGEELIELSDGNYDKVKKVLDKKVANPTVRETLAKGNVTENKTELVKLTDQSFDDLFKNGGLAKLKDMDTDAYKEKYKEKFGKYPTNV